jgi:HPr kinase/phosphorylase
MAYGATLVSDDRTEVFIEDGNLRARAPSAISGLVEARGVGILRAESCGSATLELAVDLDRTETARLPRLHTSMILDRDLPCLHKIEGPYFPAAILQYLKAGRQEPR